MWERSNGVLLGTLPAHWHNKEKLDGAWLVRINSIHVFYTLIEGYREVYLIAE